MKPVIDIIKFHKKFFIFLIIIFIISFYLSLIFFKNINDTYKINLKLNSINGNIIQKNLDSFKKNSKNIIDIRYFNSINEMIIEIKGKNKEPKDIIKKNIIDLILKEYEKDNKIKNDDYNEAINKIDINIKIAQENIKKNNSKKRLLNRNYQLLISKNKDQFKNNNLEICSISFLLDHLENILEYMVDTYLEKCPEIKKESLEKRIIQNKFHEIIEIKEYSIDNYINQIKEQINLKNKKTKELIEINLKHTQNLNQIKNNGNMFKIIDYDLLKSFLLSIIISILILIIFDIKIRKINTN